MATSSRPRIAVGKPGEGGGRPPMEFWYRYEDKLYASAVDEFGDSLGEPHLCVELLKFVVHHHTPKGVWLERHWGGDYDPRDVGFWRSRQRFVLNDAYKKYAHPTLEEAKISFIARKNKQIRIYNKRIEHAERAIAFVQDDRMRIF